MARRNRFGEWQGGIVLVKDKQVAATRNSVAATCMNKIFRSVFGLHIFHCVRQHQLDPVELVDLGGAGIVVDGDDVGLG